MSWFSVYKPVFILHYSGNSFCSLKITCILITFRVKKLLLYKMKRRIYLPLINHPKTSWKWRKQSIFGTTNVLKKTESFYLHQVFGQVIFNWHCHVNVNILNIMCLKLSNWPYTVLLPQYKRLLNFLKTLSPVIWRMRVYMLGRGPLYPGPMRTLWRTAC